MRVKNQYAGTIGDYGKYGLLRALCRDGGLRLGMAWWMSEDDGSDSGGRIGYLEQRDPALRDCDPELFDALARMVTGDGGASMQFARWTSCRATPCTISTH